MIQTDRLRSITYLRNNEITNKKVILRTDFNVPLDPFTGKIIDDARIKESLPTIQFLLEKRNRIVIISHVGRPLDRSDEVFSMQKIANQLSVLLPKISITFFDEDIKVNLTEQVNELKASEILVVENIRYYHEETSKEASIREEFAQLIAKNFHVYVNDAFGTSHRDHASISGLPLYLPSYAGFLVERELNMFARISISIKRPYVVILGGSKVATKLRVLYNLINYVDYILIGGAMAYTFLKARCIDIGDSPYEKNYLSEVCRILDRASLYEKQIILPVDHIITNDLQSGSRKTVSMNIPDGFLGVDIGPGTIRKYKRIIRHAKTVFWNGPLGFFENPHYARGTIKIARYVAQNPNTCVIGGGDTLLAAKRAGVIKKIRNVSTGGGAFLKLVEGTELPGLKVLSNKNQHESLTV